MKLQLATWSEVQAWLEKSDAIDYRNTFPDGRIGSEPGLSSIEHGEKLYHAGLKDAMEAFGKLSDPTDSEASR